MKGFVAFCCFSLFLGSLRVEAASFSSKPERTLSEQATIFPGGARLVIRQYPSSIDPTLHLLAEFFVPAEPKPLLLFFHGWHMTAAQSRGAGYITQVTPDFFVVNVDMRGRGESGGLPDASGHELIDGLDALDFARRTWPSVVDLKRGPYVLGGSGGGSNTLALVGRAPDRFAAAVSFAGVSDYALWYSQDEAGRYRDEMETWIGGTPQTNPRAYRSRGGLTVLDNVISGLLVIHGRRDGAVPFEHAQAYRRKAERLGKKSIHYYFSNKGHESEEWAMSVAFLKSFRTPPRLGKRGNLILCGFLACAPFWVIAEDPAEVGRVKYELDRRGRVKSLRYFGEGEGKSASRLRVRLFDLTQRDRITNGNIDLPCLSASADYREFAWETSYLLQVH